MKNRRHTQQVIRPKLPLDELRFDSRLKIRTQRKKLHLMMVPSTAQFFRPQNLVPVHAVRFTKLVHAVPVHAVRFTKPVRAVPVRFRAIVLVNNFLIKWGQGS